MDITPGRVGANVDVTTESLQLLDFVALAYAANPDQVGQLLLGLASAREERDLLIEFPGVDRPVAVSESAELELDVARDVLAAELPDARVVFTVAETDCRKSAAEFQIAADQSAIAIARAHRMIRSLKLPRQQDRRHAA